MTEGKEAWPGEVVLVPPVVLMIGISMGVANVTYDLSIVVGGGAVSSNTTPGEAVLGGMGMGPHGTSTSVTSIAPSVGPTAGCIFETHGKCTGCWEAISAVSHTSMILMSSSAGVVSIVGTFSSALVLAL